MHDGEIASIIRIVNDIYNKYQFFLVEKNTLSLISKNNLIENCSFHDIIKRYKNNVYKKIDELYDDLHNLVNGLYHIIENKETKVNCDNICISNIKNIIDEINNKILKKDRYNHISDNHEYEFVMENVLDVISYYKFETDEIENNFQNSSTISKNLGYEFIKKYFSHPLALEDKKEYLDFYNNRIKLSERVKFDKTIHHHPYKSKPKEVDVELVIPYSAINYTQDNDSDEDFLGIGPHLVERFIRYEEEEDIIEYIDEKIVFEFKQNTAPNESLPKLASTAKYVVPKKEGRRRRRRKDDDSSTYTDDYSEIIKNKPEQNVLTDFTNIRFMKALRSLNTLKYTHKNKAIDSFYYFIEKYQPSLIQQANDEPQIYISELKQDVLMKLTLIAEHICRRS